MLEILKMLSGPVIGAVIGYFTNYIAVKMLFRPLNPIKIGKRTLPLTPGIIPKRKPALARALGEAVGSKLIDQTMMKEALKSPEVTAVIAESVASEMEKRLNDEATMQEQMARIAGEEKYEEKRDQVVTLLSEKVADGLQEMNISKIIIDEGVSAIKEKTKDSMLAMFMNDQLIASITTPIAEKLERYVQEEGAGKIRILLEHEISKLEEQPLGSLAEGWIDQEKVISFVCDTYHKLVDYKADAIFNSIDLVSMVENKVGQMSAAELEKLVLSVMQKELGMVVRLGAVIGFILGLLNLIF